MTIHNSLTHLSDFVGKFSKHALEGATLTSLVTFGPHLFKRYVYPEFTPLLDMPAATAFTVAGAMGYSAYQTILDPASSKTHDTFASIPKKVSDFVTGLFASKSDKKEKKSLYSTTFWGLGMLSAFGYLFTKSSESFAGMNPLYPVIGSAAITLGGSFYLNKALVTAGKNLTDKAKKSDLFHKTCEMVDHIWTFGGTSLKLAILGSGIWGISEWKKTFVDPVVTNQAVNASITVASTLWSWNSSAIGSFASGVEYLADKVSPLFDFAFSSSCYDLADNKFIKPTIARELLYQGTDDEINLCPDRVYENMSFINSYIKPTWDFSAKIANGISSTAASGYRGLSYGLFVASGLVFSGSTLKECEENLFKTNNKFLCTNAGRVNSVFINYLNPLGTGVKNMTTSIAGGISSAFISSYTAVAGGAFFLSGLLYREGTLKQCTADQNSEFFTNNPSLCANAERIDSFVKNQVTPLIENITWAKDQAILWGDKRMSDLSWAVQNPTVQKAGAAIVATGVGLYGLHFLATKAKEYFEPSIPTPIHDIEQGPVHDAMDSDIIKEDGIPARKMEEPSAPPIALMKTDKDLEVNDATEGPLLIKPENLISNSTASRSSSELAPPVSFWSRLETFTGTFIAEMKTWIQGTFTSLSTWWNNLWTKKEIDKK